MRGFPMSRLALAFRAPRRSAALIACLCVARRMSGRCRCCAQSADACEKAQNDYKRNRSALFARCTHPTLATARRRHDDGRRQTRQHLQQRWMCMRLPSLVFLKTVGSMMPGRNRPLPIDLCLLLLSGCAASERHLPRAPSSSFRRPGAAWQPGTPPSPAVCI